MEDLYDPEEKILCPYNSSHHIRRCKMSFHLVKCKKNYEQPKMIPCDFNATHIIPEPELKYHHQICPDRKVIESQICESQTRSESRFPIPKLDIEASENWDNENAPTYDPKKYVETHEVLRSLDVESGAKRKNFRLQERQRLGGFNQQQNQSSSVPEIPKTEAVQLPPHRSVSTVDEEVNPQMFQQKIKINTNRIYLQYKPSPKQRKNN